MEFTIYNGEIAKNSGLKWNVYNKCCIEKVTVVNECNIYVTQVTAADAELTREIVPDRHRLRKHT